MFISTKKRPDVGLLLFDIAIALAALMTALFILFSKLPHNESDASNMYGSVCAELYWDNTRNVDLDLWSLSPKDKSPVGYKYMHDAGTDLFRDVIGFSNNPEHVNMEVSCTKALYEGEYIFDVHYFSNHEYIGKVRISTDPDPLIKANLIVKIKGKDKYQFTLNSDRTFIDEGEEHTLIAFNLDKEGRIVQNSINFVDRNIIGLVK
jgi:hypothetical protein